MKKKIATAVTTECQQNEACVMIGIKVGAWRSMSMLGEWVREDAGNWLNSAGRSFFSVECEACPKG